MKIGVSDQVARTLGTRYKYKTVAETLERRGACEVLTGVFGWKGLIKKLNKY
jgi:hypothetical protein